MTTVGAVEPGEALSEIATAIEFLNDFDCVGPERSVNFPGRSFVLSLEIIPSVMDDLPKRRGTWAARSIDRLHKCLSEHLFNPLNNAVHIRS